MARGARQEGGGQHDVAARRQGGPQCHAAGVHVDGAGRLLHHVLHPAAAVHLHLRGDHRVEMIWFFFDENLLTSHSTHPQHLKTDRQVLSLSVFPPYSPVLLLQTDQHLLLFAPHPEHELENPKTS